MTAYDWFAQKTWNDPRTPWSQVDPLSVLGSNGVEWLRAGVTTLSYPELESVGTTPPRWLDGFWCSREYTLHVLEAGAGLGMRLSLFFNLTDTAGYGGHQPTPAGWEAYTPEQTADALEQHTKSIASYYQAHRLRIERYEIGNEIDMGVTGFSIDGRIVSTGIDVLRDVAWLRANVWQKEAIVLKGAIHGVKAVDPSAHILLHLTAIQWPWLIRGFISAMVQFDVPFDEIGFSYYPWLNFHPETASPADYFEQSVRAAKDFGKRVVISEFSFPSSEPTGLPVVTVPSYPFTPEGQTAWVRDFLRRIASEEAISTVFYFYPDNFLSGDSRTTALFNADGTTKPAMSEFGK